MTDLWKIRYERYRVGDDVPTANCEIATALSNDKLGREPFLIHDALGVFRRAHEAGEMTELATYDTDRYTLYVEGHEDAGEDRVFAAVLRDRPPGKLSLDGEGWRPR